MRPERFVITDRIWGLVEPLLPGTHRSRGVTGKDNRLFLEAVLWKVRVGGQWRDLPLRQDRHQLRSHLEHRSDNHRSTLIVNEP